MPHFDTFLFNVADGCDDNGVAGRERQMACHGGNFLCFWKAKFLQVSACQIRYYFAIDLFSLSMR